MAGNKSISVVVLIEGREAIPVRALPFVTGWSISPDVVADSLALEDSCGRFSTERRPEAEDDSLPIEDDVVMRLYTIRHATLSAYRQDSFGNVVSVKPKEWDLIVDDLGGLSARLNRTGETQEEQRPIWIRESIPLLPAGVFVWRDEFESAFGSAYGRYRLSILDERDGDRGLTFDPIIPGELHECMMEGFTPSEPVSQPKKPHGGSRRFGRTREECLGAAITVLVEFPDQCRSENGKITGEAITSLIEEKAPLFWPDAGEPPLQHKGLSELIARHVNKLK